MWKRDSLNLRISSYAILFVLVGVGLFLRWTCAVSTSPFIDEFKTLWNAKNIVAGVASPFAWGPGADAPLFRDLEALVLHWLGFDPTIARMPSIFISVATILLMFYVGKRMFSFPAALLACALMTFTPELVIWDSRAREYPLFLLLTLLSTFLFYRWMIEPEDRGQINRRRGWLFVVCFVAALFAHLEAILLLPGFALSALIRHGPAIFTRKWVFLDFFVCGAAVILVLALFLHAETTPGAIPLGQTVWAETARIALGVKNLEVFSKFFRRMPGGFVLASIALGGFAYSTAWALRERLGSKESCSGTALALKPQAEPFAAVAPCRQNRGLVLLYVLLLWVTGAIIFVLGPLWGSETRYVLFLFPIFSLVVGAICVRLLAFLARQVVIGEEAVQQWMVLGFITLGIALIGVSSVRQGAWLRQEWGYDLAFDYVGDQWRKGDVMVTVAPVACLVSLGRCDYFAIQKAYETYAIESNGILVETVSGLPLIMTVQGMEEVLDSHERVWFVTDEGRFVSRYESDFAQLVWDRMELLANERGVLVFRSLRRDHPLIEREIGISFEDKFRLLGCNLNRGSFAPGEKLELTLCWQGLDYTSYFGVDYSVFVHLVDHAGKLWAQVDGYPVNGFYPTSHWRSTDIVIRDRREIMLPLDIPTGLYRLDAGMYTLSDLRRLSIWDNSGVAIGDSVTLGYIKISAGEEELVRPVNSMDVTLGHEVALLGYDLISRRVSPGEALNLTMYWRAEAQMNENYTVFVHLVDEDGVIWGQHDEQPLGGFYPTSYWAQGEVVTDRHSVLVEGGAPPGEYDLRVGMYLFPTMRRLPVVREGRTPSEGWVSLGIVRVSQD